MRSLPTTLPSMRRAASQLSSLSSEEAMNEKALSIILTWLDGYEEEKPDPDWPQQEYEECIFSKWALGEILELVLDNPWTSANVTVLEFAMQMLVYAGSAGTDGQERIFRIAATTAFELLENIEEV